MSDRRTRETQHEKKNTTGGSMAYPDVEQVKRYNKQVLGSLSKEILLEGVEDHRDRTNLFTVSHEDAGKCATFTFIRGHRRR